VAYQAFAHDHGDQFPFQVPVKEGGTLEFVKAASAVKGDFYFAFRHFQSLSNDLVATKVLVCPADKRTNATTFALLRNDNISYFVGATAEYTKPDSLLAGDRNLSVGFDDASLVRLTPNTPAAWTSGCHEFKGNILFAGGHVEGMGNVGLASAIYNSGLAVNTLLPPVLAPGGGDYAGASTTGNGGTVVVLQEFFQAQPSAQQVNPISSPPIPLQNQPANRPTPVVADAKGKGPGAKPGGNDTATKTAALAAAATNRVNASTNSAAIASTTSARPATSGDVPEASANVFVVVMKPEQCWPCWIAIMLLALISACLLGREVMRQRRARLRALSPLESLTDGTPGDARARS
jgi:prepilin-type processing-associated H-X9-DG protein